MLTVPRLLRGHFAGKPALLGELALAAVISSINGLASALFDSCPKTVGAMKETVATIVTTNKQAVVRNFFIIVILILMLKLE